MGNAELWGKWEPVGDSSGRSRTNLEEARALTGAPEPSGDSLGSRDALRLDGSIPSSPIGYHVAGTKRAGRDRLVPAIYEIERAAARSA